MIRRGFSYRLMRLFAGMENVALQVALERLAEADILLVQGLPPESEYRFKHALIRMPLTRISQKPAPSFAPPRRQILRDRFRAIAAAEPEAWRIISHRRA